MNIGIDIGKYFGIGICFGFDIGTAEWWHRNRQYFGICTVAHHYFFQQDGATASTAGTTMHLLKTIFPNRFISCFVDVSWPPRSPVLRAPDFSFFEDTWRKKNINFTSVRTLWISPNFPCWLMVRLIFLTQKWTIVGYFMSKFLTSGYFADFQICLSVPTSVKCAILHSMLMIGSPFLLDADIHTVTLVWSL